MWQSGFLNIQEKSAIVMNLRDGTLSSINSINYDIILQVIHIFHRTVRNRKRMKPGTAADTGPPMA